jgi:hypothetical protein
VRVRTDWLPFSAALLLTGSLALALGSILTPTSEGTADTLRIVEEHSGQWMAAAAIYFVAAVFLTLGLPTALVLLQGRGRILGLVSAIVLELGFIGTAGYAMLMVFFRALVNAGTLGGAELELVVQDNGLMVFIYGWIVGFVLGELLLAIALLRARTVPRWVPLALVLHVVTVMVASLLPDAVAKATILLFVAGMAGIAITATQAPEAGHRTY